MNEEKRYCECGCGSEVKVWKNQRSSPFLRGHHTRKKDGYKKPSDKFYCKCGCGEEILPLPSGHVNKYIHNHYRKNKPFTIEQRAKRLKTRYNKEATFSPYIPDTFISFKQKRWYACIKENGKYKSTLHSNAVYKYHFGDVSLGYVVHHKDGKHTKITDDRPENLMLLLDKWNLRFFPVLAKGFNIPEKFVTDAYLAIFNDKLTSSELFTKLCEVIVKDKNEQKNSLSKPSRWGCNSTKAFCPQL